MATKFQFNRGLETNRSSETPASGEPLWTTDEKRLYVGDGSTAGGVRVGVERVEKHITIETPESGDDITWFFTNQAITLSEIRLVAVGSSPSSIITIRHGTSRSGVGTIVDGNTVTSTTTGHDVTVITDPTIPADSFVWIEVGTTTGTVTSVHVTVLGTVD